MALINKLQAVGDAIRSKTGKTEQLSLDQMVNEIEGIQAGPAVIPGMDISKLSLVIEANTARKDITQYTSMLPTGWVSTEIGTANIKSTDNKTTIVSRFGDYAKTGFNFIPNITDISKLKVLIVENGPAMYFWVQGMSHGYTQGYYTFPCLVLQYDSSYGTVMIDGYVNNSTWKIGIDFVNKKLLAGTSGTDYGYIMIYEKGETE